MNADLVIIALAPPLKFNAFQYMRLGSFLQNNSHREKANVEVTHEVSASACRWNSSSSSAAVIRDEAGLCRIEAVRGATGVPDDGVPPG